MKIGIVCYPTFGGSGVVATELGKALAEKGHEVHFITYSQPQRLDFFSERVFYHEVSIRSYPLFQYEPYESALTSTLVNVAKFQNLDVLHVHYAIPHASAAVMARQILEAEGIYLPVITTLHGTDITLVGKDSSYEPVVSFSINQSDAVTAVSNSLRADSYQYFHITQDIRVIPNFIDTSKFRRLQKDHFRRMLSPHGERILVHTSNFRKVKRVHDVLDIFLKVQEKMPCKLLFVGDGPERADLESRCRELGTCDNVRYLGKLEAVEEVLSVADVFLMPSETESFGLAALEAMACQVPVVSSDRGGLPELIAHGRSGFLSPLGDLDSMVEQTLHILQAENLPHFRQGALEQAKQFDIGRIVPQYEALYEEISGKVKSGKEPVA